MARELIMYGIAICLTMAAGIYLLYTSFNNSNDDVYITEFPDYNESTITDLESQVNFLDDSPLASLTGNTYSAKSLLEYQGTLRLADDFYTVTDDPSRYDIFYYQETGIVMIMLYAEPLGFTRKLAERKLKEVLPYSDVELCDMPISVSTNEYVIDNYDNTNFSLSFCSGSVELD